MLGVDQASSQHSPLDPQGWMCTHTRAPLSPISILTQTSALSDVPPSSARPSPFKAQPQFLAESMLVPAAVTSRQP